MKIDITFLVITYNQEEYILECLESIKHQRIKHLANKSVQLAVTDDFSKDKTFDFVRNWIDKNGHVFNECIINRNEKNLGINRNLRKGFSLIKGTFLKMVAGDDLLPKQSVAIFFEMLKDYDFVMGIPVYFSGKKEKRVFQRKTVNHIVHEFIGGGKSYTQRLNRDCFVHGSSVYLRAKLVKDEYVNKVMQNFSFLEDYPMWYGMGESFPNMRYKFITNIAILYRRTENSAYLKCPIAIYDDRIQLAQYILSHGDLKMYDYIVKKNELYAFRIAKKFGNYALSTYLNFDAYVQKLEQIIYECILPIDYRDISRIIQQQKRYISAIARLAKSYQYKEQK